MSELCHTIMQPSPKQYKITNNCTPLFEEKEKNTPCGSQKNGGKSDIVVSVSEGLKKFKFSKSK